MEKLSQDKKFEQIKNAFKDYYHERLRSGKLIYQDTEKGIWGPSIAEDVFDAFKKLNLKQFKHFLDLGSGDGSVVFIASLFTDSTGIEFDREMHDVALKMQKTLEINSTLINDDYFRYDFSKYDIIFINPDQSFHRGLEKKIKQEFKGTLIVYNMVFKPETLKSSRVLWGKSQTPIYVFILE